MKYCTNCGKQLPDTAKFCGKCGEKQDEVDLDRSPKSEVQEPVADVFESRRTKKCPYCAEEILEDANICRYCRKKPAYNSQTNLLEHIDKRSIMLAILMVNKIALLMLMLFTPIINISYNLYGVSGSIMDLNIFSGFEISDLVYGIRKVIGTSFETDIGSGMFLISIIYLLICIAEFGEIIYFMRISGVLITGNHDWNRQLHKPILLIIYMSLTLFLIFVISNSINGAISNIFEKEHLRPISVSLTPTAILIIILIILHVIINIKLPSIFYYFKAEQKNVQTSWKCKHCGTLNFTSTMFCEFCDHKRNN